MTIWLDAHLPPSLAPWIRATFSRECVSVRDLGLRHAQDEPIFEAARQANAIVATKDADFPDMVKRLGPPPQILWLRCGNASNAALRVLFTNELLAALEKIDSGEAIVELGER